MELDVEAQQRTVAVTNREVRPDGTVKTIQAQVSLSERTATDFLSVRIDCEERTVTCPYVERVKSVDDLVCMDEARSFYLALKMKFASFDTGFSI